MHFLFGLDLILHAYVGFFFGILNFATSGDPHNTVPTRSVTGHQPAAMDHSSEIHHVVVDLFFVAHQQQESVVQSMGSATFSSRLLASNLILSNSEARPSDVFKSNQKLKQAAILINKSKSEQAVEDSVCAYLAR